MTRLYVVLQFACMGVLLFFPPTLASGFWLAVELFGVAVGLHAAWVMRRSRLNVFPEVLPGATLVEAGLYRHIRHPMYLAVLLVSGAVVATRPEAWRVLVFLLLLVTLHAKIAAEERLLVQAFPAYRAYQRRTGRLLPRCRRIRLKA